MSAPGARPKDPTGWAVLGLTLACLATLLGLVLGALGVLYAGVTLLTGAPGHVQLSALRLFHLVALPAVGPLALLAGIVSLVVVLHGRARGLPGGRRLAITGIVLSAVCLGVLLLGLPLVFVEPCFDLSCD